jgi:WS/DGAT/MGAT family acyltransferase
VPGTYELIRDSALRYAGLPFGIGQTLPGMVQQLQDPRSDFRSRLRAVRDTIGAGFRPPSVTPLNQPIGPHRRFDWLAMDLAKVKEVKNKYEVSLNDVVLATVAGAVRSFLQRRRVNVDVLDFRVMAPVSMRTADERGTLGNRVSAWIVPMPLDEKDPRKRIREICATTSQLKQSRQALGAEVLSQVGEWTPSTLLSLAARMATRALPFNLVVTNVPGPQVPLYMLGARMRDSYGLVPLMDNLCLGIVLFSYAGKLCWGFTCDWDLLPDLHDFVIAIERSFNELRNADLETMAKKKPVSLRVRRSRRRAAVSR